MLGVFITKIFVLIEAIKFLKVTIDIKKLWNYIYIFNMHTSIEYSMTQASHRIFGSYQLALLSDNQLKTNGKKHQSFDTHVRNNYYLLNIWCDIVRMHAPYQWNDTFDIQNSWRTNSMSHWLSDANMSNGLLHIDGRERQSDSTPITQSRQIIDYTTPKGWFIR